jgi:uncharacterized DUF497 family protein
MKRIEWDKEKNELLRKTRGVCFEDFIESIAGGDYEIMNNKNYPHQKFFVVSYNNYPHCIPYVEDDEKIFLKTIFANRKLKKGKKL